ncbi:MAG TPA: arylesterase [Gallionella sp.]|nr:arylesterase [Gallionella sp.]
MSRQAATASGRGGLAAFAMLLIVALNLLVACGGKPEESALPQSSKVLALGDSLTAGAGVTPEQAWPALLASRTGWEVVNGGVSGDRSGDALARLPALLEEHQPVLVLVTLGGNDMLRHVPEAETVANLERILDMVRASGAKAVLLATPKPSVAGAVFRNLSPPEFYLTVAEGHRVPLIEEAIPEVLSDPAMKGDPLHPNAEGHALLAGKIIEALRAIGYVR